MSVFNLPERLAAKADPALIAGDERQFAALAESLEQSVSDLSGRLEAVRRLDGVAGQDALERDLEIHRLSARLRTLRRYGLDLCLGRMVEHGDADPVYVGRVGLTDSEGGRLLVDWRSPAAEPFFAATHANPMGLASRRRYRWTLGRITDYWDEVFTAEGLESNAALDDQSAFIASLGSSRSSRMRDVLATIAADQDAIIRAPSRGALVVDGGPGTGKTVVALHRAAYLLYADPRLSKGRGDILFVGPHQPYLNYVGDVLPSLGEEGVQLCTLRDLVPEGAAAEVEPDAEVARRKASDDPVALVDAVVREREQPPTATITVSTPWEDLRVNAGLWAEAFRSAAPKVPHNEARDEVWDELLTILADQLDSDIPEDQRRRAIARDDDLREAFAAAWPLLDPVRLAERLVQHQDGDAWTVPDLPFLDAARLRVGNPDATRRKQERDAALAFQREQMDRVVEEMIAADDSELKLSTMLRGADAQNSLIDESALPSTSPDELAGPFTHIIVDEAQELTDAEWQMLLAAVSVAQLHHRRRSRASQARIHRVLGRAVGASRHPKAPRWRP